MLTKQDNSIRKAAVFVQSLDHEAAETLYARLSYEEASQLRDAVRELDNIQEDEHELVVKELRYQQSLRKEEQNDSHFDSTLVDEREGVALEIGSGAYHAPIKEKTISPQLPDDPADWFGCLAEADPIGIAGYLTAEQPRAIAVVLSYVAPDLAASILAEFPEQQQTKVLLQLASLGEADPTSVRVLATGLSTWIKRQEQEVRVRENRLSSVKAIVAATPKNQRQSLVSNLKEADHTIAEEIEEPKEAIATATAPVDEPIVSNPSKPSFPKLHVPSQPTEVSLPESTPRFKSNPVAVPRPKPLLSFSDLDRIDAQTLTQGLTKLTPRNALLALVEASDTVLKRIESKLSKRSVQELRQRLVRLGPTSLAEIDRAKEEFLLAAEHIVRQRRAASLSNKK